MTWDTSQSLRGLLLSLSFCVMSSRQHLLVAASGMSTHADGIRFSLVLFLLCCLAQSIVPELTCTFLNQPQFFSVCAITKIFSLWPLSGIYEKWLADLCLSPIRPARPWSAGSVRHWSCLQCWVKQTTDDEVLIPDTENQISLQSLERTDMCRTSNSAGVLAVVLRRAALVPKISTLQGFFFSFNLSSVHVQYLKVRTRFFSA